jgi:hypothetical protein
LLQNGYSLSVIGNTFGVEKTTISAIKRGKTWRHVAA